MLNRITCVMPMIQILPGSKSRSSIIKQIFQIFIPTEASSAFFKGGNQGGGDRGRGLMGSILPVYAVGILIYFAYIMYKVRYKFGSYETFKLKGPPTHQMYNKFFSVLGIACQQEISLVLAKIRPSITRPRWIARSAIKPGSCVLHAREHCVSSDASVHKKNSRA